MRLGGASGCGVQLWSIAAEQQWKRVLIAAHTWRATLDAVGDPRKTLTHGTSS
jgi:hypothetical protein